MEARQRLSSCYTWRFVLFRVLHMKNTSGRRSWIKLWCEPWLTGSTRFELTLPQRAIWIDLLAMAGRSKWPGIIAANIAPPTPRGYPLRWLAATLNITEVELADALERCKLTGKLTTDDDTTGGFIIRLSNWEKYQSEYQRQKPYRYSKGYKASDKQSAGQKEKEKEKEKKETDKERLPVTVSDSLQQLIFRVCGTVAAGSITDAVADHTERRVAMALREAEARGKRTWVYVLGILKGWARDGEPRPRREAEPDVSDVDRRYRKV